MHARKGWPRLAADLDLFQKTLLAGPPFPGGQVSGLAHSPRPQFGAAMERRATNSTAAFGMGRRGTASDDIA